MQYQLIEDSWVPQLFLSRQLSYLMIQISLYYSINVILKQFPSFSARLHGSCLGNALEMLVRCAASRSKLRSIINSIVNEVRSMASYSFINECVQETRVNRRTV
jgi:hypothetical protein